MAEDDFPGLKFWPLVRLLRFEHPTIQGAFSVGEIGPGAAPAVPYPL